MDISEQLTFSLAMSQTSESSSVTRQTTPNSSDESVAHQIDMVALNHPGATLAPPVHLRPHMSSAHGRDRGSIASHLGRPSVVLSRESLPNQRLSRISFGSGHASYNGRHSRSSLAQIGRNSHVLLGPEHAAHYSGGDDGIEEHIMYHDDGHLLENGGRLKSLDLLRGLAACLLILLGHQGSDPSTALPSLSAWHGITLADTAFSSLLFSIGVAIPLSAYRPERAQDRPRTIAWRIGWRSALLFLMGMFLSNFPFVAPDLADTWRPMGTLQRVAVVYATCAGTHAWLRSDVQASKAVRDPIRNLRNLWRVPMFNIIIPFVPLALWLALTYSVYVPNCGRGQLTQECSTEAYFDSMIFGRRHTFRERGYDPEGVLSHLTATLTGYLGMRVGISMIVCPQRLRVSSLASPGRHAATLLRGLRPCVTSWLLVAIVLGTLAYTFHAVLPINRQLWTPTFLLHFSTQAMLSVSNRKEIVRLSALAAGTFGTLFALITIAAYHVSPRFRTPMTRILYFTAFGDVISMPMERFSWCWILDTHLAAQIMLMHIPTFTTIAVNLTIFVWAGIRYHRVHRQVNKECATAKSYIIRYSVICFVYYSFFLIAWIPPVATRLEMSYSVGTYGLYVTRSVLSAMRGVFTAVLFFLLVITTSKRSPYEKKASHLQPASTEKSSACEAWIHTSSLSPTSTMPSIASPEHTLHKGTL
ncbi:hypothetical protein THASP1DRAFT_21719 [Thamnocephalis sphaerospora]|uniref:Heparan-alpha-glucosaminide N-acetyltransferase catalytic domain-containing protein n=1 Tax=Thamnocephalis sphaerospora TaxID=78915 RepID=A0A4P9XYT4_9FUNG|nr:hypothetical protein THASP1DRAFT_21719 [Thamnocephalis sphaerospora]|eukprot:RKP10600.1 hypothetical protein THASP1DRAFT_21719 [Thamnocephalis sphaerospora]